MEKAFNKVWHTGFLHKVLKMYIPISLIGSFLSDQSLVVNVEEIKSTTCTIQAGVPQGSSPSSSLFNIYSNDMPVFANAKISLFTNDTMFFTQNKNAKYAELQLQKQVNLVADRFLKLGMKINPSKSVAILFGHTRPKHDSTNCDK